MALPKEVTFVTFDVYGTLIDWETGAYDAFAKEAEKDGYTLSKEELVPLFLEIQQEIKGGSYELYAEVLRRTAVQISRQLGWPLEPSRSGFLPDSVKRWPPFKETNTQLDRLRKKYELGLISNIDDKLLGETRRHFKADFDLVVTAQQVRSYKPDPAHFKEAERRIGGKKGWVHVTSSYYYDVEPCLKAKVPVIWVNRNKETLDASQKKPTAEVKTLLEAAKLLGAALTFRAPSGLHEDVIAVTSRAYATGCVLVRSGAEAFCIDSPVFPDELDILPAMAAQAEFNVVGVIATHLDWDHLLGRIAFPEAPLGLAESSAARLVNEPGAAQRELRDFDDEFYVTRPAPLSLPGAQRLDVPGYVDVGDQTLELHPADGHTVDGMAAWIGWASVLVAGDYLSPVEIPMISPGGSLSAYFATLNRLEPLVEAAAWVVPGHGGPIEGARALAILREDRAYVEALLAGDDPALPLARRTKAQREIHAKNLLTRG